MIAPEEFCSYLKEQGISFYSGVPDSLLKNLCAYIESAFSSENHLITANEGNAIALATGHYLGSGAPGVVYMQNSGLGNAINPLTSLADKAVYSIPMLLVIGWRGEPGVKDEPQHVMQGEITEEQLTLLGIPYAVADQNSQVKDILDSLIQTMKKQSRPVALLVRKNTFSEFKLCKEESIKYSLKREKALEVLLSQFSSEDLIVSTTGKTSRELFELRQSRKQPSTDFLTVGAMGHTASIGMGIALARPDRRVIAIDGDGSMLMHMGSLAIIGSSPLKNLVHVVLNNQCHESVGGQPTVAGQIDIKAIALASGYKQYRSASDETSLVEAWHEISTFSGPVMLEVKIATGSRADLGRPTNSPLDNKQNFMIHAGSA